MVRPRQGESSLSAEIIKQTARAQMKQAGPAGISLRAIGRELGVTAPAIYNYFNRLDDLYTELIIDAYNGLAGAIAAAADEHSGQSPAQRLRAALLAYRAWALAHPEEFSLIFGTPLPNYHAPAERTTPAARRVFAIILHLLTESDRQGELCLPVHLPALPAGLQIALPPFSDLPSHVLYVGIAGWVRIHGLIMLELFGHTTEMMNDTAAFYAYEVDHLIEEFGLKGKKGN